MVISEPVLVVIGIGTLTFTLAAARLLTIEAGRSLESHFLQVKAQTLRNNYHRQLMALRSEPKPPPTSRAPAPDETAAAA